MTGREKSWGLEKDLVCGMRGAALCSAQRELPRRDLDLASGLRKPLGSFQSMGSFPGQHGWVGKVVITNLTVPVGAKEYPTSRTKLGTRSSRARQPRPGCQKTVVETNAITSRGNGRRKEKNKKTRTEEKGTHLPCGWSLLRVKLPGVGTRDGWM
jgi:hypothetical protein